MKASMSAPSWIFFGVGFPPPWPARVSMRIRTGAWPPCAACSVAAYLKVCAGHDAIVVVGRS